MERPSVVWIFSLLVVAGIVNNIYNNIPALTGAASPILFYASILSLVIVVLAGIFIYHFFMLKRSSVIWLYITFGASIVINGIAMKWITVAVTAVFGWVVWDYIVHKKIGKKQLFS